MMTLWQATSLGIDVKPRRDIIIRGADGQPLAIQGTGEVWVRDPLATFWKKVKLVVTVEGSWTLISPKDQKRLLLLQRDYPRFSERDSKGEVTKRPLRPRGLSQTQVCQAPIRIVSLIVKRRTKERTRLKRTIL